MRLIKFKLIYITALIAVSLLPRNLDAQSLTAQEVAQMSFEDLLNKTITTASKVEEPSFESPLSSTVLTREEILKAGSTSIPEALRLVPGVIVREQTNGNYDVHIRGFEYLPPGSLFINSVNNMTLVMIDNRPVHNYLNGGTFWNTLPVDINDVDRIEIIRGPVSALYGPNAVTGVIHIITRSLEDEGPHAEAHIEGGRYSTGIARASVGYKESDAFSFRLSANGQKRERKEVEYYSFSEGKYVKNPSELNYVDIQGQITNPDQRFPDEDQSLERGGVNLFIESSSTDDLDIDFDVGFQDSEALAVYHDISATPLGTLQDESYYFNSKVSFEDFNLYASYNDGEHNLAGDEPYDFEYQVFDTELDYLYEAEDFSLRPSISYRHLHYESEFRFDQEEPSLDLFSAALRGETSIDDVSLIAAGRVDRYNHTSSLYVSYQFVLGYDPSEDHHLRLNYGRAYRSFFMEELFERISFLGTDNMGILALGNEDIDPLVNDTIELGWRAKLTENLQSDFELWWSLNRDERDVFPDGSTTIIDDITFVNIIHDNVPLESEQWGGTLSFTYSEESWSARIFGTLQQTDLTDNYRFQFDESSKDDGEYENTPIFYGGFYLNWMPANKWNVNLSSYYFSDTEQISRYETESVSGKFLLNSKISYQVCDQLQVFFNARNLTNSDNREFARTDQIDGLFLLGAHFNLN